MTNILVPTDFSENSWNAIAFALAFFKNFKCNFYLAHIIQKDTPVSDTSRDAGNNSGMDKLSLDDTKEKLNQLLENIEKSTLKGNHRFFVLAEQGDFIESIRKQVLEKNIDMIVMGTKGASLLKTLQVGRNTSDVITKVKCTALVVPDKAAFKNLEEIAFPTDYNLYYPTAILETISEIANRLKSTVKIIYLAKTNEKLVIDQQQNKELLKDYFHGEKHSFHTLTNKNIEVSVQNFIEENNIGLIAMAAKNIHFFKQLFFNTGSKNCAYHTQVPFLVLHE